MVLLKGNVEDMKIFWGIEYSEILGYGYERNIFSGKIVELLYIVK